MLRAKPFIAVLLAVVASALLVISVQAIAIVGSPSTYIPFVMRGEGTTTPSSGGGSPIVVQAPVLTNGDFEQSDAVWTEFASERRKLIRSDKLDGVVPHSGRYVAKLGGVVHETSAIVQWFEVPRKARELIFSYQIRATAAQGTQVGEVSINGDLLQLFELSPATQTNEWETVRLDISKYAGKKITLYFQARTDVVTTPAEWYIDDVYIP